MKKFLYSLAIAGLAFTACNDFDDDSSKVYPDGPAVTVDVKASGDSAIIYSVSATAEAQSMAYAVLEGDYSKKSLSADDVLALDGAEFLKPAAPVSGTLTGLAPYTVYSVVAVAYSQYGKTGEVVVKTAKTSDVVTPEIEGFKVADTTAVVTFSEPIAVADTASIHALLYLVNEQYADIATVTGVQADGNTLIVYFDGANEGDYVSVGWEDGAITDLAGNSCGALEAGFDEEAGNLFDRFGFKAFALNAQTEFGGIDGAYADFDNFVITISSADAFYKGTLGVTFQVSTPTMEATIKSKASFVDTHTLKVSFPAEMTADQKFSVALDSAAVVDASDNPCKALTLVAADTALTARKAMPLADILGTYTASFAFDSEKDANTYTETWTIADAGVAEGYESLVTISGIEAGGYITTPSAGVRAVFNSLSRKLTIADVAGGGAYKETPVDILFLDYTTQDYATLTFLAPGKAAAEDFWMVYYDGLGTIDYLDNAVIVRN